MTPALDSYFTKHNKKLQKISANIVSRISKNKSDDCNDLLGILYEHIYSNKERFEPMAERGEIEGYCVRYMKNQWYWDSTFHKTIRGKDNFGIIENQLDSDSKEMYYYQKKKTTEKLEGSDYIIETKHIAKQTIDFNDELIYIVSEDAPESALDYITDLKIMGYSTDQIERILKIKIAKSKLNMFEQITYELYFDKQMSIRDIAKYMSSKGQRVSQNSVFKLVTEMKNKLKECVKNNL